MVGSVRENETPTHDIVEAHWYVVTTGEQVLMSIHICSRINQSIAADCRTFLPQRPSLQLHTKLRILQYVISSIANPKQTLTMC